MSKQKFTRVLCLVLATLFLVSTAAVAVSATETSTAGDWTTNKSIYDYLDKMNTISYEEYMVEHSETFAKYKEANLVPWSVDATVGWVYENDRGTKNSGEVDVIEIVEGVWTLTVYEKVEGEDAEGLPVVLRVPTGEQYTSVEAAVASGKYKEYDLAYVATYDGVSALYLPAIGKVTWTVPMTEDKVGLYNVGFGYYPVYKEGVSKSASIERDFYINGAPAFAESRSLTLSKIWSSFKADKTSPLTATYKLGKKDNLNEIIADAAAAGVSYTVAADEESITVTRPEVITQAVYEFVEKYNMRFFITDANNNELRPTMVQTPEWTTYSIRDNGGFYSDNFGFVLTPDQETGNISFTLEGVNELMAIREITVTPYAQTQSYESYINALKNSGVDTAQQGGGVLKLEAENTYHTSTNGVYPIEDRSSPFSSPSDTTRVLLNTIGTEKWSTPGQWVEYKFTVSGSGMYDIYTRYKQSYLDGMYVGRSMAIYTDCTYDEYVAKYGSDAGYYNGYPFKEASSLRYDYSTGWEVTKLSDGNGEYQIYFREGVNYTIRLEVTLGSMSARVQQIQSILDNLNADYLAIIKLTGTTPDDYRDYGFNTLLPDTLLNMLDQAKELRDLSAFLKESAGVSSTYSGTCDKLYQLIEKMVYNADEELAKNLDNFKQYVGNLGTFLTDAKTQPLQLDYLMIQPATAEAPKGTAGFFQTFIHECKSFFQSFVRDYNSMGAMEGAAESMQTVDVWLAYGRDQSQVIRNLTTNKFTPENQIAVNLKLISGGTLLPSILAGMGPDVYLGLADETVINYAIRGALTAIEDINRAEFDYITDTYFTRAAMLQLEIADSEGVVHTYGLPETQTFQMMFVRTDILAELGIEIPKTWDEIYKAQSKLEANNMEIGLNTNYKIFLYQDGGDLYADDGMRINLDSQKGLDSFNTMCELFTMKSFPYSYNAANRFRTGEMPIILADYTGLYNQLKVFATEIDGRWTFVPVPGTIQADGSINNTADSTIAAVVMIDGQTPESKMASWKFMTWYTGAECQTEYANEMVAIIGDSAKHPTANRAALESMPWSRDEYEEVSKQFENLAAIPNYPGSYYIGRHTGFAFLAAYNERKSPTEELRNYISVINKEITRKREEFKLETLEIGQTLASKRMNQAMNAIDALVDIVGENSKYKDTIEATKYAIANQKIDQLDDASLAFSATLSRNYVAELNAIQSNKSLSSTEKTSAIKAVVEELKAAKNADPNHFFVNVGKQTAEIKNGGYRIDSLSEQELVYFIAECLRNAADALASYQLSTK